MLDVIFKKNPKRIGLALSAGSALGLAHVGVLEVLESENIEISAIAGTSMGSLIGGLFAAGKSAKEIRKLAEDADFATWAKIFFPTLPKGAIIDSARVSEFMETFIDDILIESLQIPYAAVATDFITGEEIVMREGILREAIRASTAIPGIFSPPYYGGRFLTDGGLANPVPVDVCRSLGADFVIAVNVNSQITLQATEVKMTSEVSSKKTPKQNFNEKMQKLLEDFEDDIPKKIMGWIKSSEKKSSPENPFGLFEAISQAFSIVYARNLYFRSKKIEPDFILEPDTSEYSVADYDKFDGLFRAGKECAEQRMAELKKLIKV